MSGARIAALRQYFASQGREPFDFQERMWRAYWSGESGLLNAGTGSGKTLAAWLGPVLDDAAPSQKGLRLLWITPLRALARDLEKALLEPLQGLGSKWRVEQRTGDTPSARRTRQCANPPHALITTPESLSVLLSHADMTASLGAVTSIVVDEWHEFLGTKRGVQLELCLARLRALAAARGQVLRIWGLSATLPDLPDAMRTLLGPGRAGTLIRAPEPKRYEIDSLLPASLERFAWSGHLGLQLLPQVIERIARTRTTLVFTNTRSQAEIWYQAIVSTQLDWLTTTALHHGSIDAKIRRRVEDGLKSGALRCVVCTSSLDLGVDFPPVDQVLQIGSPKSVARLLQRAGRSGHQPGQLSRVTVVPTHAWELVECAAARHAAEVLDLEPRTGLTLALDVLAQHLVTLATGEGFTAAAQLAEVRGTHAFAELTNVQWQWTLDFITRGGSALQGYPEFRRVEVVEGVHRIAGVDLARRHRRAIGTITSDASMSVSWQSGGRLGTIEESFVSRLRPRDVFIFGGRVLQLMRVRDSIAYVQLAKSKSRYVPRWQGSRLPLSASLGRALLAVLERRERGEVSDPEMILMEPLLRIQEQWSAVPTSGHLLVESLRSREGFHLFVFPFAGRLLNEGVATLMSARAAREQPRTFSITTNEYGFELLCAEAFDVGEATLQRWASPEAPLDDLLASINASELARRQFRDIARIAGLIDPGTPRKSKTARQLQVSSGLMYDVLQRHDPENLLLEQARREVLTAQLAYQELTDVLARMATQRWLLMQPPRFTPLSFPLWADRLQTQTLSTESWRTRVEREAQRLERRAAEH
ncbi:MAG: ligase-associated DNA damage response DEXH box helicase [Steroidobacteraceae bacterium]